MSTNRRITHGARCTVHGAVCRFGVRVRGSRLRFVVSCSGNLAPCTWHLALGTWHLALGTLHRHPGPGTWHLSIPALRPERSRDVAVSRADAVVGSFDLHPDAVELAVRAVRRRVAEHVLAVQLLGDARGRRVDL